MYLDDDCDERTGRGCNGDDDDAALNTRDEAEDKVQSVEMKPQATQCASNRCVWSRGDEYR